jgi:histidinol dehydrogenase
MTFGTETILKCIKSLVQESICDCVKAATQFGVAIDMPTGPSELLIVADDTAVPAFVASDLLSGTQRRQSSDLVSASKKLIDAVDKIKYR